MAGRDRERERDWERVNEEGDAAVADDAIALEKS